MNINMASFKKNCSEIVIPLLGLRTGLLLGNGVFITCVLIK